MFFLASSPCCVPKFIAELQIYNIRHVHYRLLALAVSFEI